MSEIELRISPVVDGFLDDPVWKDATSGQLNQEVREENLWSGSEDFEGSFAAVWRNGFLYIAIQLTDDQVETHHEKLSLRDHLEIYLDIDHTGHKSDLYRHIIPVGQNAPPSNSPPMMVVWGSNGRSCELSVNFRYTLRKDEAIGFAIRYNDVDGGRLNHRVGWGPAGYNTLEDFLADLVFTAKMKQSENQKAMQWARIKNLY